MGKEMERSIWRRREWKLDGREEGEKTQPSIGLEEVPFSQMHGRV